MTLVANIMFFLSLIIGFSILFSFGLQFFNVSYNKKMVNMLWILMVLLFSYFLFFAEPFKTEDLYRHYKAAEMLGNSSFSTSMLLGSSKINSYGPQAIWNLYIFIIGKLGIYGLIPAMGYFITRIVILPIWNNYRFDSKEDKIFIFIMMFSLALCDVHLSFSGVRCTAVMAILAYAYLCIYLKKVSHWQIKCVFISFICFFIHIATLVPILILTIYEITKFVLNSNSTNLRTKKITKVFFISFPFICVFSLPLIGKVLSFCKFNEVLILISNKIHDYTTYTENYMFVNHWSILKIIMVVFALYILYKSKQYVEKNYYYFTLYFIYFSIIVSFGYTILWDRVLYFIAFLSLPAIIKAFENNKINKYFKYGYVIVAGLVILLNINASMAYNTFNGVDFYRLLWKSWGGR